MNKKETYEFLHEIVYTLNTIKADLSSQEYISSAFVLGKLSNKISHACDKLENEECADEDFENQFKCSDIEFENVNLKEGLDICRAENEDLKERLGCVRYEKSKLEDYIKKANDFLKDFLSSMVINKHYKLSE